MDNGKTIQNDYGHTCSLLIKLMRSLAMTELWPHRISSIKKLYKKNVILILLMQTIVLTNVFLLTIIVKITQN